MLGDCCKKRTRGISSGNDGSSRRDGICNSSGVRGGNDICCRGRCRRCASRCDGGVNIILLKCSIIKYTTMKKKAIWKMSMIKRRQRCSNCIREKKEETHMTSDSSEP